MDNIRVYDAAKELGLTNKEMIEQLETKIGVKVKSHSSTLTISQFERFKETIKKPATTAPKKPKAFIVKKVKTSNDEVKQQVTVEEIKPTEKKEEKKTVIHSEKETKAEETPKKEHKSAEKTVQTISVIVGRGLAPAASLSEIKTTWIWFGIIPYGSTDQYAYRSSAQ